MGKAMEDELQDPRRFYIAPELAFKVFVVSVAATLPRERSRTPLRIHH